jgi:collagenase-like PrtC family protease
MEMLKAALACGADAVYLGCGSCNARANALISKEHFAQACVAAEARGVKVYLALNVMLRDRELQQALETAAFAQACGAAAVIVQDFGLLRLLHKSLPGFPIHASTQMSVQTAQGLHFLANTGVARAVAPRECTKPELAALVGNAPCEIEVFVHGAHCMSVSGQCRMSVARGDRSGNRGECAQPCRLPFAAVIPGMKGKNTHALSLKDLSLLEHATEPPLAQAAAFKIEGRLKRPEYVAAVVTALREKRDGAKTQTFSSEELRRTFSRNGFTQGYFQDKRSAEMFGKRPEDEAPPAGLLSKCKSLYCDTILPEIVEYPNVPAFQNYIAPKRKANLSKKVRYILRVSDFRQALHGAAEQADLLVFPLDTPIERFRKFENKKTGIAIPACVFGSYEIFLGKARDAKANGAAFALCETLDAFALAREAELIPIAGIGMNLANSPAFAQAADWGAAVALVSPECSAPQIRDLQSPIPIGIFGYGRLPLMLCRVCPLQTEFGCAQCNKRGVLLDRKGVQFPVACDCGCATVYNSRPHWLADVSRETFGAERFHLLHFTTESPAECARILHDYQMGKPPQGLFTRGMF